MTLGVDAEIVRRKVKHIVGTMAAMNLDMAYEIVVEKDFSEPMVRGCNRICPCRLSINCRYYFNSMDIARWKEKRGNDEEFLAKIWEYYNTFFKITFAMPESCVNG